LNVILLLVAINDEVEVVMLVLVEILAIR